MLPPTTRGLFAVARRDPQRRQASDGIHQLRSGPAGMLKRHVPIFHGRPFQSCSTSIRRPRRSCARSCSRAWRKKPQTRLPLGRPGTGGGDARSGHPGSGLELDGALPRAQAHAVRQSSPQADPEAGRGGCGLRLDPDLQARQGSLDRAVRSGSGTGRPSSWATSCHRPAAEWSRARDASTLRSRTVSAELSRRRVRRIRKVHERRVPLRRRDGLLRPRPGPGHAGPRGSRAAPGRRARRFP